MEKAKRNSSIELIKLLAVFFIILSSASPYTTKYAGGYEHLFVNLSLTDFSVTNIFITVFRWCGQIGDTLFIVCSAWFLCDSKRTKPNKVLKIIFDTWILSVIGLVIALIFITPGWREIFRSLFPTSFGLNWFVGCYVLYFIIHPFINRAVEGLSQKQFRVLCIALFVLYSIVSVFGRSLFYASALVTFICLHLFVKYIKKYDVFNKISIKVSLFAAIGCLAAIIAYIIAVNFAGKYIGKVHTKNLLFCRYDNPVIILFAVCVLNIAVKKTFYNTWINKLAAFSLLIYLLHSNYFWLAYGKWWLMDVFVKTFSVNVLSVVFIMIALYTVSLPLLSLLYSKTLGRATDKLSDLLGRKIETSLASKDTEEA